MKIGLIDVDSHNFPNLPLMKLSTYHKKQGDTVEWCNALDTYDVVYQSKIFDFTPDFEFCLRADEVIKGGTGYDLENKLSDEVEHCCPDYSLYSTFNEAYGFLTRGCPRGCPFCIVAEKEGKRSVQVADLGEFYKGQKQIKLLDPNLLANKDREYLLDELNSTKAYIDFTQGLDIRMMTDSIADKLNRMKIKMIHFAWDNYEFETYEKLKYFRDLLQYDMRKLRVYVLTNFDTTHEQDLERIYKLRELDYDPYVMIYDKDHAPKQTRYLQRWVNNKRIFRLTERFEEYDHRKG